MAVRDRYGMAPINDTPLLTLGQVEKWTERRNALEKQIRDAQEELVSLNRNLDASRVFLEMMAGNKDAQPPQQEEAVQGVAESEGPSDAVVRITGAYPQGATPSQIKEALAASGFDMKSLTANPGYLYTILGRLVRRGKLEKRRNGLYRKPASASSPQGETGAVGTPARH